MSNNYIMMRQKNLNKKNRHIDGKRNSKEGWEEDGNDDGSLRDRSEYTNQLCRGLLDSFRIFLY